MCLSDSGDTIRSMVPAVIKYKHTSLASISDDNHFLYIIYSHKHYGMRYGQENNIKMDFKEIG
jgi:hypothetical protein